MAQGKGAKRRLPGPGSHEPGERRISPRRPRSWNIEWDDRVGLNFDAYACALRAPYLQNVTSSAATVLWRVNAPRGHDLARPLERLRAGQPFALRVGAQGYLCYQEREAGINLGWSKRAEAQWELRPQDERQWVEPGCRLALWNRAASDSLVYARRSRGINLRWHRDSRVGDPAEWTLGGALPRITLRSTPGGGHLAHRERGYGIDLGWSDDPAERMTVEGLALDAEAWVAPLSQPVTQGQRYSTAAQEIFVSDVSWSYQYARGVEQDQRRAGGWERYWLLHRRGRPTLQLEVRFTGLRPGATYHYRIRSAGADPNRPLRDDAALEQLLLADDITFRTAPSPAQGGRVRFAAMGDLGPGKSKPSYFYDVCDLFTRVARDRGAQLWLPLGDLDNDTDGHPNGLDPFFFNVYNAYRDARSPHNTSAVGGLAQPTSVRAFGNPRYHGLLGGLPAFPTFGNHDICLHNDGRMRLFRKAYFGSFVLPSARDGWCDAARDFNAEGAGFFYTFRWGNVIFVSLGLPQIKGCWVAPGESWKRHWGKRQERSLERYLSALGPEAIRPDVWVIVYFHDQDCGLDRRKRNTYQHLFLRHGVDLALMGHDHQFQAQDIRDATRHYRALVVGTGGFGDPDPGDHCRRPGFVLLDVSGDTLCYWKYDTHRCDDTGTPVARDALDHRIREHCRMTKTGLGAHRIEEDTTLNEKC